MEPINLIQWIVGKISLVAFLGLLISTGACMAQGGTVPESADPMFAKVPLLSFEQSPPMAVVSVINPSLTGPASGKPTDPPSWSQYVFGLGKLTEIRLSDGKVIEHAIEFDRKSREIYDAGANTAWLGPDQCIYFGMHGKPARVGRFDPAKLKMEMLGVMEGHAVLGHLFTATKKLYIITYPCMLSQIDLVTGKVRHFGRLSSDGLYPQKPMWIGVDLPP